MARFGRSFPIHPLIQKFRLYTTTAITTITGIARITRQVTATIAGVARVNAITLRTVTGLARITKQVQSAISGIARIGNTAVKTVTGLSRVTQQSFNNKKNANPGFESYVGNDFSSWSESVSGSSTITVDTVIFHKGLASAKITVDGSNSIVVLVGTSITATPGIRYAFSFWHTSDVAGQLQVQITGLISGVTNYLTSAGAWTLTITRINVDTVPGAFRNYVIVFTTDPSQTTLQIAEIKRSGSGSQSGKSFWVDDADLWQYGRPDIGGLSRITATTLQLITGKSRIGKVVSVTTTGLSRIAKVITRTTTGVANITVILGRTITGKSRITGVVPVGITGKAQLINTTAQTVTGKAYIVKILSPAGRVTPLVTDPNTTLLTTNPTAAILTTANQTVYPG